MISTLLKQYSDWIKFIRKLESKYPVKAYIAGGCLRDTCLGKQYKDVDIFLVPTKGVYSWDFASDLRGEEGWCLSFSYLDEDFQKKVTQGEKYIMDVFEYKEYNIILLYDSLTLTEILAGFDFGICMIGMDSAGHMLVTDEFLQDADHKSLTLYRSRNNERRKLRLEKMQEKFPDYEIIYRC